MAEDVIGKMSEDARAEHREQIAQQFASFRRTLDGLASRIYVDHFTEDLTESPEYATIIDGIAKLEQIALEKYRP